MAQYIVGTQAYLGSHKVQTLSNDTEVFFNTFLYDDTIPVVTSGLVLYLDSTNAASYPGSGTSWFNLVAGVPITASLVNGVTYKDGYLQTNGTDQYISIPVGSGVTNLSLGISTTIGATRYADTSGNGRMMSGQTGRNWLLGHFNNTTLNYYAEGTITGVPGGPNDTTWRVYTGTTNTTTDRYDFYVNGVNSVTSSVAGAGGLLGMEIGRQYNGTEYSSGSVAVILVYDRVLSPAEVTQNYNAIKSKVGLT